MSSYQKKYADRKFEAVVTFRNHLQASSFSVSLQRWNSCDAIAKKRDLPCSILVTAKNDALFRFFAVKVEVNDILRICARRRMGCFGRFTPYLANFLFIRASADVQNLNYINLAARVINSFSRIYLSRAPPPHEKTDPLRKLIINLSHLIMKSSVIKKKNISKCLSINYFLLFFAQSNPAADDFARDSWLDFVQSYRPSHFFGFVATDNVFYADKRVIPLSDRRYVRDTLAHVYLYTNEITVAYVRTNMHTSVTSNLDARRIPFQLFIGCSYRSEDSKQNSYFFFLRTL
ncbi:hypothetical protein PUN28_004841 [Cardiocondyla obscurior]|uniref:Uncharacterized protein n=1 Tax=Cardiocondyla obscurior TaxID=286306 RepID=A0AAW2GGQ8_9HYME